jgi:UPF0716 family protein affecting phage T7 exclusion
MVLRSVATAALRSRLTLVAAGLLVLLPGLIGTRIALLLLGILPRPLIVALLLVALRLRILVILLTHDDLLSTAGTKRRHKTNLDRRSGSLAHARQFGVGFGLRLQGAGCNQHCLKRLFSFATA